MTASDKVNANLTILALKKTDYTENRHEFPTDLILLAALNILEKNYTLPQLN